MVEIIIRGIYCMIHVVKTVAYLTEKFFLGAIEKLNGLNSARGLENQFEYIFTELFGNILP